MKLGRRNGLASVGVSVDERPWLESEAARSWLSTGVATGLTAAVMTAWAWSGEGATQRLFVLGCFLAWTLLAGMHTALTLRAFNHLTGTELRTAVAGDRHLEHGVAVPRSLHQPDWPVYVSALALLVVSALVLIPSTRSVQALLGLGLAMVVASWANVAVTYAVHYARVDALLPGLDFPGSEEPSFTDYLYMSIAVQTTFGTTDVDVQTRVMRRVVLRHCVLAFGFNTVIVAILISHLLSGL